MHEPQHGGVQCLAREGGDRFGGFGSVRAFCSKRALFAVERIADERAAEMREMRADLVCAARVQATFQQCGGRMPR